MKKVFATFLVAFALLNLYGCSSSDTDPEDNFNKILAYNYATKFVKQSLKSPSTAEFPGTDEKLRQVKHLGDFRYQINSWVDSQNGFGAMVRSGFECIVKIDKENSTYMNEKLIIN